MVIENSIKKIIDLAGNKIKELNLAEAEEINYKQDKYIFSSDKKKVAYTVENVIEESPDDDPFPLHRRLETVVKDLVDSRALTLKAADFTNKADDTKNYSINIVQPLLFSEDNDSLFVLVFPFGKNEACDSYGLYSINLSTKEKDEIYYSVGYNDSEPDGYNADEVFIFGNIYPDNNFAIVEKGLNLPREIGKISLSNGVYEPIYNPVLIDSEAALPFEKNSLSSDGNKLVLDRGAFNADVNYIKTYNAGFHILNLENGNLQRDFMKTGNFISWNSDGDKIIYKEFRASTWDDQSYKLKVLDINTKESITIYEQIADRPLGLEEEFIGKEYYEFVGLIEL